MNEMLASPEAEKFVSAHVRFAFIVGLSQPIRLVHDLISKAACGTYPVLVLGETGTGKELVARLIHFLGKGSEKPFVPVDCSALAPTLIESELFGYLKGAFTGAFCSRHGLIESANRGTVFLDEIADLPVDQQGKLLRIIQEREVRPLGSTERRSVSVRFIAATNRRLETLVSEGKFRRDLYYRLNVLQIKVPPLRERKSDIPLLVSHFLKRSATSYGRMRCISNNAMDHLLDYSWPGNVRELENAIDHACALGSGPVLDVDDLPEVLQRDSYEHVAATRQSFRLKELERRAVLLALQEADGNKFAAARLLGIGKTTLYRKLKNAVQSRVVADDTNAQPVALDEGFAEPDRVI